MKIFFAYCILLFFLSCNHERDTCANVYLNNRTSYDITLEGYGKGKLTRLIKIPANGRSTGFVGSANNNFMMIPTEILDSANIKFNDDRIIVQYCDGRNLSFCPDIEKSLVYEWEKQQIKVGRKTKFLKTKNNCQIIKNPYEITFYKSDYDRAVKIIK